MNEAKRRSLGLPTAAFTPVVSKARHLRFAVLTTQEWQELRSSDERVWLFRPSGKWAKDRNVRRYLRLDVSSGGCNREAYKVSIRKPWYQTPIPGVPDAFLSGMSQHGPWLCINETGRVNATNTLYVVTFVNRDHQEWYKWALALLSSGVQRQFRRIGRRYADGLVKFEPGSLGKIELPEPTENADHKKLYARAVAALLSGKPSLAREIADSI